MPYEELTAERIREVLARRPGFVEKKMFGGVGFMLNGNMCCGVWKKFLILRIGPDAYDETLDKDNVAEFDITGRPMKGWVMVTPEGFDQPEALRGWINQAISFVQSLPKKQVPSPTKTPSHI